MNKYELITEIAKKSNVSRKTAEQVFDATLDVIGGALISGDRVHLNGFGTFEVRERNATIGYNPKTKERIEIPARRIPAFKFGNKVKELVNKPDSTVSL